ncbi:MerR family transcriptional regulator [Metabacillus indicus]|uniref:MerR family transcriptional regulator n=1 Tax=Metabacillus indicus TaxID=246786 RepID=UPI0024900800|nr:MerR family transcriptional regulator [Metabacillus indicus]
MNGGNRIGKMGLRIGQVAKLSGLSVRTIDYYTRCRLLQVKRSSSNYRLYSEDVLETLKKINILKEQRLTIAEIRRELFLEKNAVMGNCKNDDTNLSLSLKRKISRLIDVLESASEEERKLVYKELEDRISGILVRLKKR